MHHGESFIINDKRQRTATFSRAKRAIDKVQIAINLNGVTATQVNTTIVDATFPSTITGIRWDLSFAQSAGTGVCEFSWAIVIVKEGNIADNMVLTHAAQFYTPEQNCLVYGTELIVNGPTHGMTKHASGTTKTMRKLMIGDRILFLFRGVATDTAGCVGVIQCFQKM